MKQTGDQRRIEQVLESLNEWERLSRPAGEDQPRLKSTGESEARIAELKRQLTELGAVFRWTGAEYVLVEVVDPGDGTELQADE
jgi:hypothetical protein